MRELAGRVALVTGGAQGLGKAICRELALAGSTVIVADRSELAHETVRELVQDDLRAVGVTGDVGDERDVARFVDTARRAGGRLDAIVNNAGTDVTVGIEGLDVADWDRVIRTNLRGPFLLTKLALPLLRLDGGNVVNIASTASKRAWPNAAAYHASKWGLLGFSHAMHAELRPLGVRVTAIIAGGMRTPFLLDRFPDLDPSKLQDPADVARAVRFALGQPAHSAIAELTVVPVHETSWP